MPRRSTRKPFAAVRWFTVLAVGCELAHVCVASAQSAPPGAGPAPATPATGETPAPTAAEPSAPVAAPLAATEYDALVFRALAEYDAGRWDEARALFERAHAIDPTARTLRTIGMAAFNQADYVGALRHLEMALVDTRKPLTDEQRTHVLSLIDRSSRMVGRYRVRLSPSGASILVDGAAPALLSEDELLVVPGKHLLRVTALGHHPLERTLETRGGERQKLELLLQPEGSAPLAAASGGESARPGTSSASVDTADASTSTFGIVSLSIGGAALIASGVTLALALSDKSDLDDGCPDRVCPPSLEDTRTRYQTLRVVSPIALGVGVVGVAVGVVLLLSGADGHDAQAGVGAPRAWLVPGGLGVRGTL
jgi:hypothetical protein